VGRIPPFVKGSAFGATAVNRFENWKPRIISNRCRARSGEEERLDSVAATTPEEFRKGFASGWRRWLASVAPSAEPGFWKYDDLAPHYSRLARQAHAAGKIVEPAST